MNPLVKMFLLRGPTGGITSISFTDTTVFTRLGAPANSVPVHITATDVQTGDLVCVHFETNAHAVNRVAVVPRAEIAKRQNEFLTNWQQGSAYGTLRQLDRDTHTLRITVSESPRDTAELMVILGSDVQCRSLLPSAAQINDATPCQITDLQEGDQIYVHGVPATGNRTLTANIVLKGGFRSIVGTIVEVSGLGPSVTLRELDSDKVVVVELPSGQIYRTAPSLTTSRELLTPAGLPLVRVGLSELRAQDAVLIIGRAKEPPAHALGLFLIAGFGTFGAAPSDPGGELKWLFR